VSFMPYVPPEQMMKDRSEYAQKGIARGKSVVGLEFADGVLFLAENTSATLHKISEIYDRIAFAAVGKYSEFEDLRISGVRLANAYSQTLSTIFTQQMKPYEVELLIGEVDGNGSSSEIYHVLFDGSITDEHGFVAIGGHAERLTESLRAAYAEGWDLATAVRRAVDAVSAAEERRLAADAIEAGVLDRTRPQRRKFLRLTDAQVSEILSSG
jgi:proteasome alpha subunit